MRRCRVNDRALSLIVSTSFFRGRRVARVVLKQQPPNGNAHSACHVIMDEARHGGGRDRLRSDEVIWRGVKSRPGHPEIGAVSRIGDDRTDQLLTVKLSPTD